MPKKILTDKSLRGLKPLPGGSYYVWDKGLRLPGLTLGVRVHPSGAKQFLVRYRVRGQRREFRLTEVESLADARVKAAEIKKQVAAGDDPAQQLKALRAAETFAELCSEYLRKHASQKKDGGKADERVITKDLLPAWGKLKAREIRRADVIALIEKIAIERAAPVSANRTRALISKIFSFALQREIVDASPCAGLPKKYRETPKSRALSDDEIKALWLALETEPLPVSAVLRVILLTGQRPGEVAGMRWAEIQDDLWTIPPERTKNGRGHIIPLSPQVQAELERARVHAGLVKSATSIKDKGRFDVFVFPSARHEYMASRTLERATARIVDTLECPEFSAHDLRRTAATGLRRLGTRREVVAKLLNHKSAEGAVTGIYDRFDELPLMRRALNAWGRHVENLVKGKAPAKVVAMR